MLTTAIKDQLKYKYINLYIRFKTFKKKTVFCFLILPEINKLTPLRGVCCLFTPPLFITLATPPTILIKVNQNYKMTT